MRTSLKIRQKLFLQVLVVGYILSAGVSGFCFAEEGVQDKEVVSVESSSGSDIAECAMEYIGCSYSWGGEDPYAGFDCSGFVYYVYLQFDVELNRTAQGQALCGESVSSSDIEAGDVLCFYSEDGTIYHSGIYIGDGMFIHSDSTSGGVIVSPVSGYYSSHGYEVRRIFVS